MIDFSFIIPVYNCERYLKKCIENILRIDLEKYEVILVDDGSTDLSSVICDELSEQYEQIRVIHQKNQGASAARNRGIQEANGEYIIFLDADDDIDIKKMTSFLPLVIQDKTIDMALYGMSFDYYYHENCYRCELLSYPGTEYMDKEQWLGAFDKLYEKNYISPVWNKVFKRNIIVENQLYFSKDMIIYEDLDFVIRYMAFCNVIYSSSEIIYHYRQAEDEGNAGRRLLRIPHLTVILQQIENALDMLQVKKNIKSNILFKLYLVLAREKISVSNAKDVRMICGEFSSWLKKKQIDFPNGDLKFIRQLKNGKVYGLLIHRDYVKVRHRLAVFFKNTKLYQKRIRRL